MNNIEKKIYDTIKSMPWLKYIVRNVYQSLFDMLPRKKEFICGEYDYKEDYFFGFHDCDPFSVDDNCCLAHRTLIPLRMPRIGEALEVGYWRITEKGVFDKFVKLGDSYAWNYHKGCRLQWLSPIEVIYNSAYGDKLVSIVLNIQTQEKRVMEYPIDSVSSDGCWASSFSYERLEQLMPGYGYIGYRDDAYIEDPTPLQTGVFICDIKQNCRKLLVSLNELAVEYGDEYAKTHYRHYVTHSEFSKDGRYLSFLHRWVGKDTRKRTSRLVIYDLLKQSFFALPTNGMVSHYVWNNRNQIIAYCNIDGIDCHALFSVEDGITYRKISPEELNSDGHQSFVTDEVFITDTYPDKYRMAKLYKVNMSTDKAKLLASIYSPKDFQTRDFKRHIACDLHSRVSRSGRYVCFDSPRTGKRAIYIMKVTNK